MNTKPSNPTHAYVGYRADGTAILVIVDDASPYCASECSLIITKGGYLERKTLDDARKIELYRSTTP